MKSQEHALGRIQMVGTSGASPTDLLAVALARREEDLEFSERAAQSILASAESLKRVGELSPAELAEVAGLEPFEATRFLANIELGRRIANTSNAKRFQVSNELEVVDLLIRRLTDSRKEHFMVVLLDSKNQVMRISTVHIGTLNYSVVGAREVFREAIREGAASIILAHNHPSGDPEPSPEDIQVTQHLAQLGKELDIPVLDHIIIGDPGYVSLRSRNVIA